MIRRERYTFGTLSLGCLKLSSYIIPCIEKGSINDRGGSFVHTQAERTGRGCADKIRFFQWYNISFYILYFIFDSIQKYSSCIFSIQALLIVVCVVVAVCVVLLCLVYTSL